MDEVQPALFLDTLRQEIRREYAAVATVPSRGFHFHTGRKLAALLGYSDELLSGIPESAIESLAGTGNPFALGPINRAEHVVDFGCGAGMDSLIAARMAGPGGGVIGIDMTSEMLAKARAAAEGAGLDNVEFREGYNEQAPVPDGWADVVISNGVLNLSPDKGQVLTEMNRALKPGGRLQIADIVVQKPIPTSARQNIDLWSG
jgi:arsenite methyltransferase